MIKTAVLLPAGARVTPEEILIDNYENIQTAVGGCFDVVRFSGQDGDGNDVALCGYVHDEGLLIGLELNYLATMLFEQPIVGPCVVTYALSPNGEYDGDDYDMPASMIAFLTQDLLVATAKAYNQAALLGFATERMIKEGSLTQEDVNLLMSGIDSVINGEAESLDPDVEMMMLMVEHYVTNMSDKIAGKVKDAVRGIVDEVMNGEEDE
jgi:hypothetical protein